MMGDTFAGGGDDPAAVNMRGGCGVPRFGDAAAIKETAAEHFGGIKADGMTTRLTSWSDQCRRLEPGAVVEVWVESSHDAEGVAPLALRAG